MPTETLSYKNVRDWQTLLSQLRALEAKGCFYSASLYIKKVSSVNKTINDNKIKINEDAAFDCWYKAEVGKLPRAFSEESNESLSLESSVREMQIQGPFRYRQVLINSKKMTASLDKNLAKSASVLDDDGESLRKLFSVDTDIVEQEALNRERDARKMVDGLKHLFDDAQAFIQHCKQCQELEKTLNVHINILSGQENKWQEKLYNQGVVNKNLARLVLKNSLELQRLSVTEEIARLKLEAACGTDKSAVITTTNAFKRDFVSNVVDACATAAKTAEPTLNVPRFSVKEFLKKLWNFLKKEPVVDVTASVKKDDNSNVPLLIEAQVVEPRDKSILVNNATVYSDNTPVAMPEGAVSFEKDKKTTDSSTAKNKVGLFSPKSAIELDKFQKTLENYRPHTVKAG